MEKVKKVNKLLFIFIFFIVFMFYNNINVWAGSKVNAPICIEGYSFMFQYDGDKNIDQVGLSKLTLNDIKMNPPEMKTKTVNYQGADLKVSLQGMYGFNSSKCYTYIRKNNGNHESDNNALYWDETYDYTTKFCNQIYDTGSAISFMKDAEGSTNDVNLDTGKITIRLVADAESKLVKSGAWDRLIVSSSYNGVHGVNGAAGTCSVHTGADKYIECTGILPYRPETYNRGNVTENTSPKYTISLSVRGTRADDFPENVDDEQKKIFHNSCGGDNSVIFLGQIDTMIKSENQIEINNPKASNAELQKLCEQIDGIDEAGKELKRAYAYECYKNTIKYTEKDSLVKNAEIKLKKLNEIYGNMKGDSETLVSLDQKELLCSNPVMGIPTKNGNSEPFEVKKTYEKTGEYWAMVCVEEYYVNGGKPSLVQAGTGVTYSNQVEVRKSCYVYQNDLPSKPEKCITSLGCTIGFPDHTTGMGWGALEGGPSSQFDSCIQSCDGGKYTQNCINSCYIKNYSNSRSQLISKGKQNDFEFLEKYEVKKVANEVENNGEPLITLYAKEKTTDTKDGWTFNAYHPGEDGEYMSYFEVKEDGRTIGYAYQSDWVYQGVGSDGNTYCKAIAMGECLYGAGLFVTTVKGPKDCSDDPDGAYQTALNASIEELKALQDIAETQSKILDYNITFVDSSNQYHYTLNGNTIKKKTTGPQLVITQDSDLSKSEISTVEYTIGKDKLGGSLPTYKGINTSRSTAVYNIELPDTYVHNGNADVIAVFDNHSNKYFGYYADESKYKGAEIKKYTIQDFKSIYQYDFNSKLFTPAQKVFYTAIDSPDINVTQYTQDLQKLADQMDRDNIPYAVLTMNGKTILYGLRRSITGNFNIEEDDQNYVDLNILVDLKIGYEGEDGVKFKRSDFSCYYGVYLATICPDDDPECHGGLRYYYREIDLNDVFPNDRNPRWNWTGTIENGKATGAASTKYGYIVDPVRLTEDIEKKGYTIYDDDSEVDYKFTLDRTLINAIRDYNKKGEINGKKVTYLDFSLNAPANEKINFSEKIEDWYQGTDLPTYARNITECNNAKNGGASKSCENYNIVGGDGE